MVRPGSRDATGTDADRDRTSCVSLPGALVNPETVMSPLAQVLAVSWDSIWARPEGPMSFRFILQPTMAAIAALRAGLRDSKEGRPAFLWAVFTKDGHRANLLKGGWKHVWIIFLVALVLDAVYQIIEFKQI